MLAQRVFLGAAIAVLAHACSSDSQKREIPATPPPITSQPAVAGARADNGVLPIPDMPIEVIDLPDEDKNTLPLPTNAPPKPPADPKITFDWTETKPADSTCQPGQYTGTFTCTFALTDEVAMMLGFAIELMGPVTFTLERSMNGEFLEITQGQFEAVANGFVGARAMLHGKLDCRTNHFEATLSDGLWAFGDPAAPLIPGGMLEGLISGSYQSNALAGMWSIGDPMLGDCDGTWNVSWMP